MGLSRTRKLAGASLLALSTAFGGASDAAADDRLQVTLKVGGGPGLEERTLQTEGFARALNNVTQCDVVVAEGGPFMSIRAETTDDRSFTGQSPASVATTVREWCGPA